MDGSILHMNSRQQMEQLDFRKRRVMMVGAVCRSLEWMRMDNRRAILDMDVIIGKTKSTNFQNEKYKKGMSFKYYINGA